MKGYIIIPNSSTHIAFVNILQDNGFLHKGRIIDPENAIYTCNECSIIEIYDLQGIQDQIKEYDTNSIIRIQNYYYFKNMERVIFHCIHDRQGYMINFTGVYKNYDANGFVYYSAEYKDNLRHGFYIKIYTNTTGIYAIGRYENNVFMEKCIYVNGAVAQMNIGETTLCYNEKGDLMEKITTYFDNEIEYRKCETYDSGHVSTIRITNENDNTFVLRLVLPETNTNIINKGISSVD